ncbi:MAG: cyclic nucleotide-binding domain-containing protein [Oligoflexia bacterium]|nr:cyclic nucleotide-binding domain-containing protein [Oligoflexia bacterium]
MSSIAQQLKNNIVNYKAGSIVVQENERCRKMFIVVDGQVRVFKGHIGGKITLAILGKGEIFGELSFFDAEPRSASVEALSDVSLVVIDGEKSGGELDSLPKWVVPVMKTVFHRFREADQRITILQSMYEFQKKSLKSDQLAQTIYYELLRFLKAMKLVYEQQKINEDIVKTETLYKELDDILGKKIINLKNFWRLLGEYDFINTKKEIKDGIVEINFVQLNDLTNYLDQEAKKERYLMLGHSSVAILKKLIAYNIREEKRKKDETPIINKETNNINNSNNNNNNNDSTNNPMKNVLSVRYDDLGIQSIPFVKEGIEELIKSSLINCDKGYISVNLDVVMRVFSYQSFLKSFDHTIFST